MTSRSVVEVSFDLCCATPSTNAAECGRATVKTLASAFLTNVDRIHVVRLADIHSEDVSHADVEFPARSRSSPADFGVPSRRRFTCACQARRNPWQSCNRS